MEEYAHRWVFLLFLSRRYWTVLWSSPSVSPAISPNNYTRAGVVINFVTATGGDVEMLRSIECFYKWASSLCPHLYIHLYIHWWKLFFPAESNAYVFLLSEIDYVADTFSVAWSSYESTRHCLNNDLAILVSLLHTSSYVVCCFYYIYTRILSDTLIRLLPNCLVTKLSFDVPLNLSYCIAALSLLCFNFTLSGSLFNP